jgi:hypothetical protein
LATRVGRLCDDPEAPFRFRLGDRVAWKRHDGTPDREVQGTIADGTCIYAMDDSTYQPPIYVVKCDNGQEFSAAEMTLMLVPLPIPKARDSLGGSHAPVSSDGDV